MLPPILALSIKVLLTKYKVVNMRMATAIATIFVAMCLSTWHLVLGIRRERSPRFSLFCNNSGAKRHGARRIHRRSIFCKVRGGTIVSNDDDTAYNSDTHTNSDQGQENGSHKKARKPKERNVFSLQETTMKARELFLDKISFVSTALLKSEQKTVPVMNQLDNIGDDIGADGNCEDVNVNDEEITAQSDILRPGRKIAIVTTASIPWFTGTAVNPLLRAAYLDRLTKKINRAARVDSNSTDFTTMTGQMITLVIPWLELEEDREALYGKKHNFTTPEEQEIYIRKWLSEEAQMENEADPDIGIKILFYPARYHSGLKSIFAMGDILQVIDSDDADVCILEEPEHLNWYRAPGDGWTDRFTFVIGIIHTNYVEYASSHYSGLWTAPAIRIMSSAMVRAYCHVVIKLSDTLQTFAEEKEKTSNVHGVRSDFLEEGSRRAALYNKSIHERKIELEEAGDVCGDSKDASKFPMDLSDGKKSHSSDVYYIGKLLWAKGLDNMLDLQKYYKSCTGKYFDIHIYGNGPEEAEIKRAFRGRSSKNSFHDMSKKVESETQSEIQDEKKDNDELKKDDKLVELSAEGQVTGIFTTHMAKVSKHIQLTTQQIKATRDAVELEFPKSFHEFRKEPIPATFPGRVDHASLRDHKIFVNPSESEVLCTTTAEALAMGKFVIIPIHPSNTFFMQFDNCLPYNNKLEFAANLHWALNHEPEPLKAEEKSLLTWEAATERLASASAITRREAKERQILGTSKLDERIAWFHNTMGKGPGGDMLRRVLGGGPISNQFQYEMMKHQSMEEGAEDNEGGGLPIKFVGSSLAQAIKTTLANAVPGSVA